ncbi:MAG: hypothetical protein ACYCX6_06400 [Vulcanimicrobiaceae bacterium]
MREPDFEASADMRLLDLQRAALGVAPPAKPHWESEIAAEGDAVEAEIVPQAASAVLAIEAHANPPGEVIPGAIVTVALSVANESSLPARGIRVSAPLPGGATYRNGSCVQDGRPMLDDVADELFGAGVALGDLAPHSRATFVWKLAVRLGNKPLVIAPRVAADGAAIIGATSLIVGRKTGEAARTGFESELARIDPALYSPQPRFGEDLPFYELDDEERLQHEAVQSALSPHFTPPAEALPEPARPTVELLGRFDAPSRAFFERTFRGTKSPTLLSHFMFMNALACTKPYADETGAVDLKRHQDAQSQLLHRIVLHEKLGKRDPITQYAGELLADLERLVPEAQPPRHAEARDRDCIYLSVELTPPLLAVVQKIGSERERWDFVKARQLTLALVAQHLDGPVDPAARERAESALRLYAQSAITMLQRFFVRIRIDRTTSIVFQADHDLDAAAVNVLAAFAAVVGG